MPALNPESFIGSVIRNTIFVERLMDTVLAIHFCSETIRQEEFSTLILFHERISFEFKKEILTVLIKKHYASLISHCPEIFKILSNIPEHRNRFAHLEMLTEIEELNYLLNNSIKVVNALDQEKYLDISDGQDTIFKRFKNGKPIYIGYNQKGIGEMNLNLLKVINVLTMLKGIINFNKETDLPPES